MFFAHPLCVAVNYYSETPPTSTPLG